MTVWQRICCQLRRTATPIPSGIQSWTKIGWRQWVIFSGWDHSLQRFDTVGSPCGLSNGRCCRSYQSAQWDTLVSITEARMFPIASWANAGKLGSRKPEMKTTWTALRAPKLAQQIGLLSGDSTLATSRLCHGCMKTFPWQQTAPPVCHILVLVIEPPLLVRNCLFITHQGEFLFILQLTSIV